MHFRSCGIEISILKYNNGQSLSNPGLANAVPKKNKYDNHAIYFKNV